MTSSLCRVIGGSREDLAWSRPASNSGGGSVRVMSRRNSGDPGEPRGLIACAVLSAWLPVNPAALFVFLRDESRRHEWDAMLRPGRPVQSCASVAKGKDRRNCVTAYVSCSSFFRRNEPTTTSHVMSVMLLFRWNGRPRDRPRESRAASGSSRTAAPTPASPLSRTRPSTARSCGR